MYTSFTAKRNKTQYCKIYSKKDVILYQREKQTKQYDNHKVMLEKTIIFVLNSSLCMTLFTESTVRTSQYHC